MIGRARGLSLFVLGLVGASPGAAAGLPTPAVAQRFVAALQRGDAAGARASLARGVDIRSSIPRSGTRAGLRQLLAHVRGCRAAGLSSSRLPDEAGVLHVYAAWTCPGRRDADFSMTVENGRVARIWFGPQPVVYASRDRFSQPGGRIEYLVYDFLLRLIGSEDLERASAMLAPDATVRDNLRGTAATLADVLTYLRPCTLRNSEARGNDLAATHWTCPGGERLVMIARRGAALTRVEIGPPPDEPAAAPR